MIKMNNEPIDKQNNEPTNQQIDEPIYKLEESTNQQIDEPTDEPNNQQTAEPNNQQTAEPNNQQIDEPNNQQTDKSIDEPNNEPTIIRNKYTFIHPTKCGGSICELFFEQYYSDNIMIGGHGVLCNENNNPIIIVRDVESRFFSMFKYWKYGSIDSIFKRDENFIELNKNKTILDFIELLKFNKEYLYFDFTWEDHFRPTFHWINNTDYKYIIVIKYEQDLNQKIKKLFTTLNIDDKNIYFPIFNISKVMAEDIEIYENNKELIIEFINDYFLDDINLIKKINEEPELFKLVL